MTIEDIETHVNCGGYWLKKITGQGDVVKEEHRCTRCGKWKPNPDN